MPEDVKTGDQLERKALPAAGGRIPVNVVTLYKDGADITVDAVSVPEFEANGWRAEDVLAKTEEPPESNATSHGNMTSVQLRALAVEAGYSAGEVANMKKKDLIELLDSQG